MNVSLKKIGIFFLAILLLGWFLYPRELFMGYIYEGFAELSQSEEYYTRYLSKHPHSRFATLRLADLYDRMGNPEKATPLLSDLYEYRRSDWDIASRYLSHLEELHDEEALYKVRREMVDNFLRKPLFPKGRIEEILYQTLLYARWKQKDDDRYEILRLLATVSKEPESYLNEIEVLDRGLKKTEQVEIALKKRLAELPDDPYVRQDLSAVLSIMGKTDEAIQLLDEGLVANPDSFDLLGARAYLHKKAGDDDLAAKDLQKLIGLEAVPADDRLGYMGQLAAIESKRGNDEAALLLYREILDQDAQREENWQNVFYTLVGMKRTEDAIEIAEEYLEKFPEDNAWRKELVGLYLNEKKDLSRLPLYLDYVRTTQDASFAKDVAYLMIEKKKYREAISWLNTVSPLFPGRFDFLEIQAEALSKIGDQEGALVLLLNFTKKHPSHPEALLSVAHLYELLMDRDKARDYFQRFEKIKPGDRDVWYWLHADLIDSLMKNRKYKRARTEVAVIKKKFPGEPEKIRSYEAWLKETEKDYDHRVTSRFRFGDLGSERFFEGGIAYRGFLTDRWQLQGEFNVGYFSAQAIGFDGVAEYGRVGVASYHLRDWIFRGGVGFGTSGARKTASPFVELEYRPLDTLQLGAGFDYRRLRTDLPSAVAAGTAEDLAQVTWQYRPVQRLILSGRYEFERNYLPSGESALVHTFEPTVGVIVVKKPEIVIGYQFTFSDVQDRGGFLAQVPLLPRVEAHYLTASINHRFNEQFAAEGHFFIGEDTARNLHFFKGDLFGLMASLEWSPLYWLDIEAFYQFGMETTTNVSGRSHYGGLTISGHWN